MVLQTFASCGSAVKIWRGNSRFKELNPCDSNEIENEHFRGNLSWSPNGQYIAFCDVSNKISITDVDHSAKTISLLPSEKTNFVSFSMKRNSNIISCDSSPTISIWDLKSQSVTKRLNISLKNTTVECAAYDKRDAFIACGMKNGAVQIFNTTTTSPHSPIVCSDVMAITSLRFSFSSKLWLGTSSDDGSCNLYDYDLNKRIHCFGNGHAAPATGISFSPANENILATSGFDKKIHLYDSRHRKFVTKFLTQEPLRCLDFSNDGHYIAVGSTRGSIIIFDLRSPDNPPEANKKAHNGSVNALLFRKENEVKGDDFTISSSKRDISSLSTKSKEVYNSEQLSNARWRAPTHRIEVANKSTTNSINNTGSLVINNNVILKKVDASATSIAGHSTRSLLSHQQTVPFKIDNLNDQIANQNASKSRTSQNSHVVQPMVQSSIEKSINKTQSELGNSFSNINLKESTGNSLIDYTTNQSANSNQVPTLQLINREEINEVKKYIDERVFDLHSYCIHRFIDIEENFEQCHKKLDNINDKLSKLLNCHIRD